MLQFHPRLQQKESGGCLGGGLGAGDLGCLLVMQVGKGDFGTHICGSSQAGNPRAWGMQGSCDGGF